MLYLYSISKFELEFILATEAFKCTVLQNLGFMLIVCEEVSFPLFVRKDGAVLRMTLQYQRPRVKTRVTR